MTVLTTDALARSLVFLLLCAGPRGGTGRLVGVPREVYREAYTPTVRVPCYSGWYIGLPAPPGGPGRPLLPLLMVLRGLFCLFFSSSQDPSGPSFFSSQDPQDRLSFRLGLSCRSLFPSRTLLPVLLLPVSHPIIPASRVSFCSFNSFMRSERVSASFNSFTSFNTFCINPVPTSTNINF